MAGVFMDPRAGSNGAPTILNSTVPRPREYLTGSEVEALMAAARKGSRYGQGDELRALRRLQREQCPGPHVFVSERGAPMAPKSFHAMIQRLGERAGVLFPIHPHMLRHGCGYELANKGHDTRALQAWLGHRNIQHTVRYTELAPDRFREFWRA